MPRNYVELCDALRHKADEIDRAVSRNKDDVEGGSFSEIELMREAAIAIEEFLNLNSDDRALLNAIVERRRLLQRTETAQKELAAVEAIIFDHYQPKE